MTRYEIPFVAEPFGTGALAGSMQSVPVCWKTLDRATARRELSVLTEWVHWLVGRYALTPRAVPPCWYRHGTIVEELSALRTGWLAAFTPDAHGSAPPDWHTMFAATRNRLDDAVSRVGCTKDDHRDDQIPNWPSATDQQFAHEINKDPDTRK